MDLQLWSDYKFNGNEKFKEYDKYANISIVLKELSELWGFLCNYNSRSNSESKDQSFLFHRYLSIVPYTCTVLLRDFENDLRDFQDLLIISDNYDFYIKFCDKMAQDIAFKKNQIIKYGKVIDIPKEYSNYLPVVTTTKKISKLQEIITTLKDFIWGE